MITNATTPVAVKERPILFSGPMVRAILEGRKTQTRRIIKPQPPSPCTVMHIHNLPSYCIWPSDEPDKDGNHPPCGIKCPFGKPGDRIWVRESHWYRSTDGITTYADGSFRTHPSAIIGSKYIHADDIDNWPKMAKSYGFKSVPSIHMPRWASRITLEITGVRVERLSDISEADAQAEGVEMGFQFHGFAAERHPPTPVGYKPMFKRLWNEINGADSWAANSWVWVIEFRKLEAAQ